MSRIAVFASLLLMFFSAQMSHPIQPLLPSRLLFQQSQAMGSQVELSLGKAASMSLVLSRQERFSQGSEKLHLQPSASHWQRFRSQLDQLQVWRWPSHCPNSGQVMDGMQWFLEIEYPDRKIQASGDNCYPDDKGQPVAQTRPTQAFQKLIQTMEALTGKTLAL